MSLNLPNKLSVARLILSAIFITLLSQYAQSRPNPLLLDICIVLFIVAAITDFMDGHIARKRGLVTSLGRVLDPFADKMLVCGAFILMAGSGFTNEVGVNTTGVASWMVVVIVGRELLVTGLRGFNEAQGKAFPAGLHGKLKMWVQSFAAPAILLLVAHPGVMGSKGTSELTCRILAWATVVVTTLSMFQYLARSRHLLQDA